MMYNRIDVFPLNLGWLPLASWYLKICTFTHFLDMTLPFAFNNFSDIYRLFMGQKNIDVLAFVFWSFHHGISEGDDQRVAIAYKNSIVMGW